MKTIACITLLAAGAFAVQDTTPPVISLDLMGMTRHPHYDADEHNVAATATRKAFVVTAKSSAGTECIRTSTEAACPLPKCEVHDHHDHSIKCNAPTVTRVRDQPEGTVNADDFALDDELNRSRLGQYLLEYNAMDKSGNAADTVTFSFLFIDPFQPNFSNFAQDEANNGFSRFGLPNYPKNYFNGNVNRHATDFEAFDGVKTYARLCNIETTHDQATVCRKKEKECSETHFGYKSNHDWWHTASNTDASPWKCEAAGVINSRTVDDVTEYLTSAQLTAGEHSFFKYGSEAPKAENRKGRTSWQYKFGATVTDKNHDEDNESQASGSAYYKSLQVYVSVNGGTFTTAETGPTIDTRTSGYQTIDYYVEDGAMAYGYNQVNNPQVHRVELEFYDQIKPKIYLKCYKNDNTYTQHRADKHDGRHRADGAAAPMPFVAGVTEGSDCISTVKDGDASVDLCVGAACEFSTPGSTAAVTLECDRDHTNKTPAHNEDKYVEPGMYVLDNVDSWQTEDVLSAEECAKESCSNDRLTISPSFEVQETWTQKVGTYTVKYTAKDTTGNKADDVERKVHVVDRFAPTLTLQGDTQVQNSAGAAMNNANSDNQNSFAGWENKDTGMFDHSYHQTDANGSGGYTCTDSCSTKANLKIDISLYQGAKCNSDGSVANAVDDTPKTQIGETNDWKFPEYVTGSYAIHYRCEDKSANWAEACREVLNVDHTRPIIQILGSNDMTLEATHQGNYIDDGATCSDQVDGVISQNVEVSGDVVNLSKVGLYKIQYNCKDNADRAANMAERKVRVEQTSCPTCKVQGCGDDFAGCSMYHEASFAYTDSGAKCSDVIDGDITAQCVTCNSAVTNCNMKAKVHDAVLQDSCENTQLIDSTKIGTYYITYVAQNTVNKWNYDDDCRGQPTKYVRTVIVQDTLKPVITLKYGKDNDIVAQGQVSTESLAKYDATHPDTQDQASRTTVALDADSAEGPGYHYRGATNPKESKHYDDFKKQQLMAEETSSGVNGWVLGAIASAVTGLALLGYSQRKTTVATSVPV